MRLMNRILLRSAPGHAEAAQPPEDRGAEGSGREHLLPRPARWLALRYFLTRRAMLLGVRGAAIDAEDRVLLVRHTYTAGWHLPGGGVEVGETLADALAKEMREETNLTITGPARLHGVFLNEQLGRRDHVAVFVLRDFEWSPPTGPNREIAACAFFPLAALPQGVSAGTRRRLAEIVDEAEPAARW